MSQPCLLAMTRAGRCLCFLSILQLSISSPYLSEVTTSDRLFITIRVRNQNYSGSNLGNWIKSKCFLAVRFLDSQPVNFYLSFLCKLQLLGSVVSVSPVLCAEQEEYLSRKYVLIILGSPVVTQSQQSYLGSVSIFAARPLPLPLSSVHAL